MARAAARITQNGTSKVSISPAVTRARVMMPIVFCASCMPWPSAMVAELTICAYRKLRLALDTWARRKVHSRASMNR